MASQITLAGIVVGHILAQTMKKCPRHNKEEYNGFTNFILLESNGEIMYVCEECEIEKESYQSVKD